MKHIISTVKVLIFVGVFATLATSCEDIMTTQTNRYMLADENLINSANDTVYSVIGILQKVQKLSDKYVLMGELRGDLLDVSTKSDISLRELNSFTVDPTKSVYSDVKDFYAVINNCNYFIKHADVSIKDNKGNLPFLYEVYAVKSIRAWTYMQLVLNYGTAYYTEEPVLTVDESLKTLPEYNQIQMLDTLISQISQLNPNENYIYPAFSGGVNYIFINPLYLLGDMYLWRASLNHSVSDYESAASYYANLIRKGQYTTSDYSITWSNDTYKTTSDKWSQIFSSSGTKEMISVISMAFTSSSGTTTALPALSVERMIVPSKTLTDLYATQQYCYREASATSSKYTPGDLRAVANYNSLFVREDQTLVEYKYINKFISNFIVLYRVGQLYLRYAEAVNRAGKPNLAFAVLKYGLNNDNLAAAKGYVPAQEIADNKEYVNIFKNGDIYVKNVGLHNRGCGNSTYNANFVIPDATVLPTRADTINFVEDAICNELALETAFEGNRFHDLMRISNHRSDPEYLAKKVASKHLDYDIYFNKLKDSRNWYLPTKKY